MDYKMILLVVTVIAGLYLPIDPVVRSDKRNAILGVLALCYGIGKTLQFWHVGPFIARWYLSDIGFIPCFAFLALHIGMVPRTVARTAFGFALMQEVFMIFMVNPHVKPGTFGARGDWVDVVIFFITYIITTRHLLPAVPAPPAPKLPTPSIRARSRQRNRSRSRRSSR